VTGIVLKLSRRDIFISIMEQQPGNESSSSFVAPLDMGENLNDVAESELPSPEEQVGHPAIPHEQTRAAIDGAATGEGTAYRRAWDGYHAEKQQRYDLRKEAADAESLILWRQTLAGQIGMRLTAVGTFFKHAVARPEA
jgi:hypothetical protein